MPEQLRRWLLPAVMVALAGVVFVGLLAGGRAPADRVDALASGLRCPTCQGVSVADSPSDSAEAMRERIAELVAAGATDAEIEQHFVDRYGQWVLLDPRPGRRTWALWALPAVALAAGGLAVWRLRATDHHAQPTPEQRAAVARALADTQGEDGRSTGDSAATTDQADDQPRDSQGSSRRRWATVVVAAVLVVAAGAVLLPRSLGPRPAGGAVTGNEVGGRDLSDVPNAELEQVVADNPDVIGMRLALARRYFQSRQLEQALEHYQQVLDREPHPEALANVGWILYTSTDQTQAAARFVEESLERDPDQRLAAWFLANIRLEGLDDPAGAAQIARRLLERDDLGPDDRAAIRQLLERAEARIAGDTP